MGEENEIYSFKAKITYKRYYNEETMFGVFGFITEDEIPYYEKMRVDKYMDDCEGILNQRCSCLSGRMQELLIGCEYNVRAYYQHSDRYGDQYNPIQVNSITPKTFGDQVTFLKTIIPERIAENLIAVYPNVVNDVAEGKLYEIDYERVKGVGEKTWEKIKHRIVTNFAISDIITMLRPIGVTFRMIRRLLEDEPNPYILKQQLERNPWIVTKIRGLGWSRADDMALKLHPEMVNSNERLIAYVKYFFVELGENDGHTWCTKTELKNSITNNVPQCIDKYEWLLEQSDFVKSVNEKVGLKFYYDIENKIFFSLLNKSNKKLEKVIPDKVIEEGIKKAEDEQGFQYTDEQRSVIKESINRPVSIITGGAGCVDCDTEFFNGVEWKKISEWQQGDLVLQYNKDGSAELVSPLRYIKQEKDYLYHFETMYGLDQCLSENHNCIVVSQKNVFKELPFSNIMKRQNKGSFHDRFITSFMYDGKGIDLSDEMIRLLVAASADASYNYSLTIKANSYNRARFRLKKRRKINRLIKLIKDAGLSYTSDTFNGTEEFLNIYVELPFRIKKFPNEWYNCSQHQLKIIADEVMQWDAYYDKRNSYCTVIKENADFIQFVFSAIGKRASISINDRRGRMQHINGKDYKTHSIDYTVSVTDRNLVSMCCDSRASHTNTKIEKYKTKDGYEYCFTVPSHMLILRRSNKIFITGNCGKSSIMRGIFSVFNLSRMSISACALSAMAAQRIIEATGYEASTIHRALGAKGVAKFKYNAENQLPIDVAFMDEGSMVNANLFQSWIDAISDNTRIIIAGDHKQLPPIGYGNVFSDLLDTMGSQIVSKLTKPMRQALQSGILVDANQIRDNKNPINLERESIERKIVHGELKDMYYIFRDNRESLFNLATKTYLSTVNEIGVDNAVIITPRKKDCKNSTSEINDYIQDALLGDQLLEIESYFHTFKLGAKVIQTENDYGKNVFNGEIGYIINIGTSVDQKSGKEYEYCIVRFQLGNNVKEIEYTKAETKSLDLAYALTTHKMQGGSAHTVIGIIDNTHYQLLDNCMLYTLLTRAKKRCLLLAEPQAFDKCIRTSFNRRNTWMYLEKYGKFCQK